MKKNNLFIVLMLTILSFKVGFAQEKVYMPFFEIMELKPSYQYATSKLLQTYLDKYNKYELILPAKTDSLYPNETSEQTIQKAKALHATYYLLGSLNRMGETLILSVNMHKTGDGKSVWKEVRRLNNPNELETAIDEIAKNLGTNSHKADDYSYTDINKINDLKKQETSLVNLGVSIGGVAPFLKDAVVPAGFGLTMAYDQLKTIFDLKFEAYFNDRFNMYGICLEGWKPLNDEQNTWFYGGGMGLHGITQKEKIVNVNYTPGTYTPAILEKEYGGGGITFMIGGGYLMKRFSNAGLKVGGRVFGATFQVNNRNIAGAMLDITMVFNRN